MEWDGQQFVKVAPAEPPTVDVKVSVMERAHKSFSWKMAGRLQSITPSIRNAIADTGAQTCSSGAGILEQLKSPESYLLPTSHRIYSWYNGHKS